MKKNETYENVAFGWLGILICILICSVIACLCSCTDEFYDNTTILNSVTELTIEGDKDTTTINIGGTDITVNVSPPNLTFNYVDSSKTIVNVGGSSLQQGNITISAVNTNTNNNDVSGVNTNGITVNADNTLTIESIVEQESCPYTQNKCIIKNCKYHHCSEYSKNHPKHKCN